MTETNDLGCKTNAEVIEMFLSLKDKYVVDVGCGGLTFTKILAEQNARVLAIDPDPIQSQLNREMDPIERIEFVETRAETLPLKENEVDGVFFAYSLHHVPHEAYPEVFEEVFRVTKPGGFLYVIEPTDCPINQIMKHYHDEDKERELAQKGLRDFAVPKFETVDIVEYHSFVQYESFEDYATQYAGRSFNALSYTAEDVRKPIVEETFEHYGKPINYRFKAKKQVMCLRGLK